MGRTAEHPLAGPDSVPNGFLYLSQYNPSITIIFHDGKQMRSTVILSSKCDPRPDDWITAIGRLSGLIQVSHSIQFPFTLSMFIFFL